METARGVVVVALAVLLVSGVLWAKNGLAEPASIDRDGVLQRFSDGSIVEGSSAMLVRMDSGVTMTIHTSGLDPGAAYTVWWVIYNNPEECAAYPDPCAGPDFDNPKVQATLLHATGHLIGNNGVGSFAAYLADDTVDLRDARKAHIELVVRSHGQPIPGMVKEQITMFDGGCSINVCESEQVTIPVFVP